jgi:hypothetical protein
METLMPRTQSATATLSDAQRVILSAAAQRSDGSLLPTPRNLTAKGAALSKSLETLCRRKFAETREVVPGAQEWRRNEDGKSLGLFITNAGLLAIGVDEVKTPKSSQAWSSVPRKRKTTEAKPHGKSGKVSTADSKKRAGPRQTKQDVVIQMLRRQSGISIEEIIAKTGWQPHSVRGFFSGLVKKKLKLPLVSELGKDGVRRYHIAAVASAKA